MEKYSRMKHVSVNVNFYDFGTNINCRFPSVAFYNMQMLLFAWSSVETARPMTSRDAVVLCCDRGPHEVQF